MNTKALRILEYDRIKELLREEAGSDLTGKMIERLSPGGDIRDISDDLRSTTEAVDLIVHKGPLPTGGLHDQHDATGLARKGGTLTMKQLLSVSYDLRVAERALAFLKGEIPEVPHITELADLIVTHEELTGDIERAILSEDEIADDASPELKKIRRSIVSQNEAIRKKLSGMISSDSGRNLLQDQIVTLRDGRYVIPVKQEHRSEFPGIVHDQSKGGATLFIEPKAVVELNNSLKELAMAEEAEIARILKNFSDRVGVLRDDIINNQKIITKLDFIMAKGKLSGKMRGEEPKLKEGKTLVIKEGRHPLLPDDKVIPIDVSLGSEYRTLVVTGPNTGGKTVTLKTVGLLTLMALSGLHIPASSESVIPVYSDVFADIGDEQSIEQSLSTFSAHMKNIVYITGVADSGSLILLDELGAGTDPTEGAALGVAILERLFDKGASTIATTHYNELKKYALSTDGVENASMEFNVDTLSPTYRLLTGVPGKSNAFEISKKLGLSGKTIRRATELIENGDLAFEDVLTAIEEDKHKAEEERREADRILTGMKERLDDFERKSRKLEETREKILKNARREAREILRDATDTADEVKAELREISKSESLGERNRLFAESRHKINDKLSCYQEKVTKTESNEPVDISELSVGDMVNYLPFDQEGEIVGLADKKGSLTIMIGSAKMKVSVSDISLIEKAQVRMKRESRSRQATDYMLSKAMSVKREKDVRGENLDDALIGVEKYIDDAVMAHFETCVIIHGKGEGILKEGIRKELKRNNHVKGIRPGDYDEGGDGVTIVTLR